MNEVEEGRCLWVWHRRPPAGQFSLRYSADWLVAELTIRLGGRSLKLPPKDYIFISRQLLRCWSLWGVARVKNVLG